MGLLTLYAGLLLPWLGGTLWLIFAESRFEPDNRHNRVRQAGYGFFLGYAVLFLAIMASHTLGGATSWPELMLFLGVFAASGGLAAWLTRGTSPATPRLSHNSKTPAIKLLTALVLVWMAAHLVFIAIDIFTQPVYPWDAWLAWVYRAKAWYLAGGISTVVSSADWAAASAANIYSIDAWIYPLFPSVIPYWSALSLGQWSETLVNVPVLFAGIAIGMALYGQCREYGLGLTTSLVCCYVLYSIPIFGLHIALAGYADIWMAGFTGLGFIAVLRATLIRGTTSGENAGRSYGMQMAVGLLMLALGVLVKNEGVVWLLAGMGLLVLVTFRARVPILILVGIAVLALFGFVLGTHHVDIPLIGTFGIVDDRLVIPFIGKFTLELHNIWRVYWDNFFAMGSWNLLWVLILAGLIISIPSPRSNVKRIGLTFFGIFLVTQLFIFGFTDQGLWADTFTAINRLPIHFTPALLFITFVIIYDGLVGESSSAAYDSLNITPRLTYRSQRSWPLLQALVVLAGLLAYLAIDLPNTNAEPLDYQATDFNFAFGSGHTDHDRLIVDGFANGYALLSSGPVNIQAATHPVLEYQWTPPGSEREAAFFWRQKGQPDNVIRTDITRTGTHLIDLSTEADWQGEIIEFGFLVAGAQGETIVIGPASLQADSLSTRLQLMWQAWTTFEERSQQSINFLQGGDYRQVVPLSLLVVAWILTGVLILQVWRKRWSSSPHSQTVLVYFCFLLLAGWMMLDIRWTANSYKQASLSLETRWQADDEQRLGNDLDGEIYQYIRHLKTGVLGDKPARILIIGDENAIDYYLLRAKYHLLPHSVNVMKGFDRQLSPETTDYVIFFGEPENLVKVRGRNQLWQKFLVTIDKSPWGVVYRIDS